MTYDKDSGLVKVWADLVLAGAYTLDQIPALGNLKEVVSGIVNPPVETDASTPAASGADTSGANTAESETATPA